MDNPSMYKWQYMDWIALGWAHHKRLLYSIPGVPDKQQAILRETELGDWIFQSEVGVVAAVDKEIYVGLQDSYSKPRPPAHHGRHCELCNLR